MKVVPCPCVRIDRLYFILSLALALTASGARAVEILDLHAAGDASGEFLALTEFRDGGERYDSTTTGRIFRRSAVDPMDAWQIVARYPRRIVGFTAMPDGALAVLLQKPGEGDIQTQLRLVRPPDDTDVLLREGATETFPPKPPEGETWVDVATADGVLHALSATGSLWRLADTVWIRIVDADASGDIVSTSEGLLLLAKTESGLVVSRLEGETWQATEAKLPSDAVAADDAGRPPLFYLPTDINQGGIRRGDTAKPLLWRLPDGITVEPDAPVVLTTAAGSVRLTRLAVDVDGDPVLVRRSADAVTLASDEQSAATLDLRGRGVAPAAGGLRLLLYAALVFAVIAMLRQSHRAGEARRVEQGDGAIAAPVAAPFSLRMAAAGVDLLPLVFTLGLLSNEPIASNGTFVAVVALVGLLTYVLLPLICEVVAGRSPGKALFGLRVVAATPEFPIQDATAVGIVVRNVTRPVDLLGGWTMMLFDTSRRRLGDFAGGTRVIYDPVRQTASTAATTSSSSTTTAEPE